MPRNKEKTHVTGPNQYTPKIIERSTTPMISFSKAKRNQLNSNANVPGPGQYASNGKLGDGVPKVILKIYIVFNAYKACYSKG